MRVLWTLTGMLYLTLYTLCTRPPRITWAKLRLWGAEAWDAISEAEPPSLELSGMSPDERRAWDVRQRAVAQRYFRRFDR